MMPKFPFFTAQQLNLDWVMQTLKKILSFMPIDKGAVGDVLQRKANGAAWEPLAAVSLDIHGLQTAEELADDDEIPMYDKTATGNRKTTVAAIRAGVASPVTSVNGQTGAVVLDADDVGALPDDYTPPVTSVNGQTGTVVVSVPVQSVNGQTGDVVIPTGGAVNSVNGQTGTVMLDAADVGALPESYVAPVTSVNGQTGAVIVSGSANLLFGQMEQLSISAPTGVTAYSRLIAQKSADGKAFRLTGALSVMKGSDSGSKVFTVNGLTITPPSTEVNVYYCGLKMDGESAFTINYTNIYDCPSVKVATDGTITITAQQDYGSTNQFTFYWFPSVIITLA